MGELQKGLNKTILLVTHDPRAAERAQRIVHLEKGQLLESAEMEAQGLFVANGSHGIQVAPSETKSQQAPG